MLCEVISVAFRATVARLSLAVPLRDRVDCPDHGGRIDFTSVEDKGSTFWFDLPAYEQESAGRPLKGVSRLAK